MAEGGQYIFLGNINTFSPEGPTNTKQLTKRDRGVSQLGSDVTAKLD